MNATILPEIIVDSIVNWAKSEASNNTTIPQPHPVIHSNTPNSNAFSYNNVYSSLTFSFTLGLVHTPSPAPVFPNNFSRNSNNNHQPNYSPLPSFTPTLFLKNSYSKPNIPSAPLCISTPDKNLNNNATQGPQPLDNNTVTSKVVEKLEVLDKKTDKSLEDYMVDILTAKKS